MPIHSPRSAPDVLVIGTGLIGLACAAAAAERGLTVLAVGEALAGTASLAAAGMLAPSIERGEKNITLATLHRVSVGLGVTMAALLRDADG